MLFPFFSLPWPEARVLHQVTVSLPSTSSRTTSSVVPRVVTAEVQSQPINISSSISSMTELTEHIRKYNLGLREREAILGDGNCWYSTIVDFIKLYDMKAPREANELRKAVTNSLHDHPQKMYWIKTQFRGSPRRGWCRLRCRPSRSQKQPTGGPSLSEM